MIKLSFLEKLEKLYEIINNHSNSLIILCVLLALLLVVFFTCRKNSKLIKILYIIVYSSIIITLISMYYEHILSLIDYLIENIITNLLFPNLALYMAMLLFINIIVFVSIFSNKIKFYVKSINIVFFLIMQLFLYLIINNVIVNNINVYEKLSIYTNQELLVLVELSMHLFVVWICVLGIIKFVDYLMEKSNVINEKQNDELIIVNNSEIEYSNYNYEQEFIEYVPIKKIKNNI